MMKLFLDTLLKFAIAKPDSLTPYTQQMADEMDELLAGVVLDEDE
jgi:antitoxin PrlF